ncbi:ArdC family protein [uncultured Methanobrevibacter sp.]|uniref:ArdC family protein n=1 Tax=uncultured Methanobrevibacter sp. TaxID=253161 RepID=UPI00258699F3|nr:ArdC family protein [uncultured Methanobrevibacter sp.]
MKISKTKEELDNMYIDSLKEGKIPWRERWVSSLNVNGISDKEYKGINQLLLSYVTYKEQYNDNRWFTYYQIKQKAYELKDAKGKGIPVEFYSVYDIKNKKKVDFADYERLVNERPETKANYRLICNTSYVFNASLIEGVPEQDKYPYDKSIPANNFIKKIISKLGVKYSERGNEAFYSPRIIWILKNTIYMN